MLHNYFRPCHRKYSGQQGQHNQCEIRADLNGFEMASHTNNHDFRLITMLKLRSWWSWCWEEIVELKIKLLKLTGKQCWRWDKFVELGIKLLVLIQIFIVEFCYNSATIDNSFPAFWLAVFSMAWYKSKYYPTSLCRVQITPKTSTNITRYLYSRGPVRQVFSQRASDEFESSYEKNFVCQ